MEALGSATAVFAVIQLAGSLVKICGGYIQRVKHAREEINTLRQAAEGLQMVLQDLHNLLQKSNDMSLPASSRLFSAVTDCRSDLQLLNERLTSRMGKRSMKQFGFRAWKWPLERTEVDEEVQKFERYKTSFMLSLQVDETSLMVGLAQNADRIDRDMDFRNLESVVEASFDSFTNRDEVDCLQGTRVEILRQIFDWALLPHQETMFWLKGLAGTGKSTISCTVAKYLMDTNHLGANFFFRRGEGDRGTARKLFPTLIKQLMQRIPELSSGVQKALRDDPEVASKSLGEQFDKLLLQPLLHLDKISQQPRTLVIVIVIDALDECEHDNDIRVIIRSLSFLKKIKAFSVRAFLTSRPELPIRLGFSEIADHDHRDLVLHEVPYEVTENDIFLFLKDRFMKIRHDRGIPESWPTDEVIQRIATISAPLFISAATMCRYIENSKWEPKRRLTELLKDQARYVERMDKTYLPILTRNLDDHDSDELEQQQLLREFQDIIGVIILLTVPFSVKTLSKFTGLEIDTISNRLDSFQSVLSVSTDRDMPVRTLHLSFRDFLIKTKSKFHINESNKHRDIALLWKADVDPQSLRLHLPQELEYSCRYWVDHLQGSDVSIFEIEDLFLFLKTHFLHWVEAMSLLGLVSELAGMISILHNFIAELHSEMSDFLQDATRFILKNRHVADVAPLQIYHSGLIFAPKAAIIRREFETELPTWLYQLPTIEERWSAELQAFEGHSDCINSVAVSPDGRLLASGSSDQTVRLWDTTGALQQTLKCHFVSVDCPTRPVYRPVFYSKWVLSVAFSPDSQLLAAGSDDGTLSLWDLATGTPQQTFKGHAGSVESVAFSPDGQLLASASGDHTVCIWLLSTGKLQQSLKHTCSVLSVAFSPDGRLVASGSNDYIIRLWDNTTGTIKQTFKSHIGQVRSVTFSPNSQLLASGSTDETVCIWDLATGTLQQTLIGHISSVSSVAFSSDGKFLASGSYDSTIRLWNVISGGLQQTLEGHSGRVQSVVFLSNSATLASGSADQTLRLWDTTIGAIEPNHKSQPRHVHSMAFSPNGRLLAAWSADKRVRLWDTTTGSLQQTLESHSRLNNKSVVFSPDGRLLAFGSKEYGVDIWDTTTGSIQWSFREDISSIRLAIFSLDSRLLALGCSDSKVRIWDMRTGVLQQTLDGHSNALFSGVFSPDGRLLACESHGDETMELWDLTTGTLLRIFQGDQKVLKLAFSPDSRLLVSLLSDETVWLWDKTTDTLQQIHDGHPEWIYSALSPYGWLLATWSSDMTRCRWDTTTRVLLETPHPDRVITELDPGQHDSYLSTNLCLCDKFSRENYAPHSTCVHVGLTDDSQWITLNGIKVLWVPPEYRSDCYEINGTLIALPHRSGRIGFMGFRI